MIFNEDIIFIHIGKTGGSSCAKYLLSNLKPPVYNCHTFAVEETSRINSNHIIALPNISRHCTLSEAILFINNYNGRVLSDFKKVIAVIRHPYTIEYSFYKHLQKPKARAKRSKNASLLELADGDFGTFIEKAGFHRHGTAQHDFFCVDNKIPDNLELVRFENLSEDFPRSVCDFVKKDIEYEFPHVNRTNYQSNDKKELSDKYKKMIYLKHKYMFDSGLYSVY